MSRFTGHMAQLSALKYKAHNLLSLAISLANSRTEREVEDKEKRSFLIKCRKLDEWSGEYEKVSNEILIETKPKDFDENSFYKQLTEFDDTIAEIKVISEGLEESRAGEVCTISNSQSVTPVKLPNIVIPIFQGDICEWTSFFALFKSLVDENPALSEVEKLHYLRTSLRGEPLDLIKSLQLLAGSYRVAVDILKERYENYRKIATAHADKLMGLSAVQTPSAKHMRNMVATYREHIEALRVLGVVPKNFANSSDGLFLFLILVRKLDPITRCQFERQLENSRELPNPDILVKFIERECQALEATAEVSRMSVGRRGDGGRSPVTLSASVRMSRCKGCWKFVEHKLYQCPAFLKKSAKQRKYFVQKAQLCFNCLREHEVKACPSEGRCQQCRAKHHSTLHQSEGDTQNNSGHTPQQSSHSEQEQELTTEGGAHALTCTASLPRQGTAVLLSTVLVDIQNKGGSSETLRALLDTGSQASYITGHAAQRLGLDIQKTGVRILGLGQLGVSPRGLTTLVLSPRDEVACTLVTEAFVLEKITGDLPSTHLPQDIREQLRGVTLADPEYDRARPVDCLLGADIVARCLRNGRIELGPEKPVALNTIFGWVLMGGTASQGKKSALLVTHHAVTETPLDSALQRFWQLEEVSLQKESSPEDVACEAHFQKTHTRSSDGRYEVRLPFKSSDRKLGCSYLRAESRFLALERRLARDGEMARLYRNFMQEYVAVGHMEECPPPDPQAEDIRHYYLPHHGILKPTSSTTKLRVVFDASSKTTSNSCCSLNDLLYSGPKLQQDIGEVLLRFRCHEIAFTADIRQMFREVWVHPQDRDYQLILWRDAPDRELKTYRLKTVTFGMTCSPFLAMRSIIQLTNDEGMNFDLATKILRRDIFVDDIVTGASTVESALELQRQLTAILAKGGFQLRKWSSNHQELLNEVPLGDREVPLSFSSAENPLFTVLGMGWLPVRDSFVYSVQMAENPPTKRGILSCLAHVYDPLGYLTPVTIWAKMLIQHVWSRGLGWDTVLPEDLLCKWNKFRKELLELQGWVVPRYLRSTVGELHGFCDASERGYAAAVYFRPSSADGTPTLLLAKSRVAPLKQVSLPRLELCGAHLLSKVLNYCQGALADLVEVKRTVAWTDSTTALSWIRTPSYTLKTFVANRVTEIQSLIPPERWRHVPTVHNPADCASRGMYPSAFRTNSVWVTGPSFLQDPEEEWPSLEPPTDWANLPELKADPLAVLVGTTDSPPSLPCLQDISSWLRMLRVVGYMLRFINNLRFPARRRYGPLSMSEIRISRVAVLRSVQMEVFSEDISALKNGGAPSKRLARLTPFLDPAGLLRVGGRIQNSELEYTSRHPIILPKKHNVTDRIIDHFHRVHLHAGPSMLQAFLFREYWILSGRLTIRGRIYRCVTCFRQRPHNQPPFMADLPASRVQVSRPFCVVSLDFAGPFLSRPHRRSSIRCKTYLCVIICHATKAIHLEGVSDLSTPAFLAAFERFIARRGLCLQVYSDCGTNFVGAATELKKLFRHLHSREQQEIVTDFATSRGLTWHFQPPAAPHFGGLHEAAVKLAKHHLRRTLGGQVLTYEELATLFCRVEAILNSRPLCPLSSDPTEWDVLTPGHFLVGGPLITLPAPEVGRAGAVTRWRLVQDLQRQFWRRWQREYLHTLIQRSKWYAKPDSVKVGTLALLQEDNLAPQEWKLVRIVDLMPGRDGVTRVVKVCTPMGNLIRPAVKVFPLPIC